MVDSKRQNPSGPSPFHGQRIVCQYLSFGITIAFIAVTSVVQAFAATLSVDGADAACSDVSGTPFCTIQAAINAAVDTDIVLVMPDTYQENINFSGKAIEVVSDQGASVTIIDGGRNDTVAFFGNAETTASILDGFTLRNGHAGPGTLATHSGGGILIQGGASPTIRNNLITDNIADGPGFGIDISGGSPIIDSNTISNNRAAGGFSGGTGGAGISLGGTGSAQIINNIISNNSLGGAFSGGGGIDLFSAGTPTIRNNYISGNRGGYGGGIGMVNASNALIVQNVIVDNYADDEGGGIYWSVPSGEPGPVVVNNTIAFNHAPQGLGVSANGFDAAAELTNNLIISNGSNTIYCGDLYDPNPPIINSNDVYNTVGTAYAGACSDQTGQNGNISVDPAFVDTTLDDYTLEPGSLAINAGDSTDPNIPATDFAGDARIVDTIVDMGAYEFSPNPGYFDFSAGDYSEDEGALSVTITVRRKAGNTGAVAVDISSSDGTAIAGSDYTSFSDTISFGDGDMADKSFTVTLSDDDDIENDEDFNLVLSNPTGGATLGAQDTATVTITDNDTASYPSTPGTGTSLERDRAKGGCFITSALF